MVCSPLWGGRDAARPISGAPGCPGERMRAWIYDNTFRKVTDSWYATVLGRLAPGSLLLDVGIGTAGALARSASIVLEKDLHVVGVDIDADYLRRARKNVDKAGIADRVRLHQVSIFDFHERGFDAAYFSASFMLMPDPAGVLRHITTLLAPEGRVFFTQTFEEKRSPIVEKVKPLLHRVTTIQFGQVTYEPEFMATVAAAGHEVVDHVRLSGSRLRSARLVVSKPI